jgi:hypothetical protein
MHSLTQIIALAHKQGIDAGKDGHMAPTDCPWPPEMYEEAYAWLSGFSVSALARHYKIDSGTRTAELHS